MSATRARIAAAAELPARHLLPGPRRWNALLASLTLDPDLLRTPVPEPGPRDFIICGCPRSGTTLTAAVLFQPPAVLTVSEPWDGLRLPPQELFCSLRDEISITGRLGRGRLEVNELEANGAVRWTREAEAAYAVSCEAGYALGVKWPAFWRYVDLLPTTKFVVCVRHPAEVVSSMRRHGGRLVRGLDYNAAFNRTTNQQLQRSTRSWAKRRVMMYELVNRTLIPHFERENVFVVRYERWFTDQEALLTELARFLDVDLGTGHARITEQPTRPTLNGQEVRLLRRHCHTAEALGYDVSDLDHAR